MTTYDDYSVPYVEQRLRNVLDAQRERVMHEWRNGPWERSADQVAPAAISGRCDVWFGMSRCALDAGHDGSCKPMSNIP